MRIVSPGTGLLCQAQIRSIPYKAPTEGPGTQWVPNQRGCHDRGIINVCWALG